MNIKTLIASLSFFAFLLFSNTAFSQSKYFSNYKPVADSLSLIYEIPASVILAIAYHESNGGESVVGRRLNNHFGLKGRVVGGDTVSVKSSYRYFQKPEDSYLFFCNLVANRKFYPALKGNKDYKKWVIALSKTGYAANASAWSKHVIGIITKYKLDGGN